MLIDPLFMADKHTIIRHFNKHFQKLSCPGCDPDSPRSDSAEVLLRLKVKGSSPNCTDVLLAFDKPLVVLLLEPFLDHGKRSRPHNFFTAVIHLLCNHAIHLRATGRPLFEIRTAINATKARLRMSNTIPVAFRPTLEATSFGSRK